MANSLPENIARDEAFIMVYVDEIGGKSYKLPVSTQEYFRFKQKPHRRKYQTDLVNWVTYYNQTIKTYAEFMTKDAKSLEEKAQLLLDFVHRTHVYDNSIEKDRDYVRYPIETMVERNGDCEDAAILAAALMKSIGIEVALLYFPPLEGENGGHVALGVYGNFKGDFYHFDGKEYFYAEAAEADWLQTHFQRKIGEMPSNFKTRTAEIHVVK